MINRIGFQRESSKWYFKKIKLLVDTELLCKIKEVNFTNFPLVGNIIVLEENTGKNVSATGKNDSKEKMKISTGFQFYFDKLQSEEAPHFMGEYVDNPYDDLQLSRLDLKNDGSFNIPNESNLAKDSSRFLLPSGYTKEKLGEKFPGKDHEEEELNKLDVKVRKYFWKGKYFCER